MMPHGWTGLALLLWGQASGAPWSVLAAALMLELLAVWPQRFAFEARQFERCADASSVLFAVVALYQFNVHGLYGIYAILALMPWCLLPLALMQAASLERQTPLSALVYSLRRAASTATTDLRLPLGLTAIVAASAGELPRAAYAAGVGGLLAWLLWQRRPPTQRAARWLGHATLAAGLAVVLQSTFLQLHSALGELVQDWVQELRLSPADAERASTAIGSLRQLKLSDRIHLRLRSSVPPATPLLLTEATYGDFRYGTWSNPHRPPVTVDAVPGTRRWPLAPPGAAQARLDIALLRKRENGVVPLPAGASELAGDTLLDVQRVAGDGVSVEAPSGLLRYSVSTQAAAQGATPPTAADLAVPAEYGGLMARLVREIDLAGAGDSPRRAIDRLRAWFAADFSYALVQPHSLPWRTPLAGFLAVTRRGHCEYFASATVLLLRAAGIPARYAVGYAVDEYSTIEDAWLARARDAHAWALAWTGARWEVVDTTPSRWAALEDSRAPGWQTWFDLASWVGFQWRLLQAGAAPGLERALTGLGVALAAWLVWRQRGRLRRRQVATPVAMTVPLPDGPVAGLLARLARRGDVPRPGETTACFLRRLLVDDGDRLDTLIALHYRARFGAAELSDEEQALLEDCVARYLARLG